MGLITLPIGATNAGTNDWADVHNEDQAIVDVVNGNIEAANLASNAVTTAKILDDAVTADKILDGTIVNANIGAAAAIAYSKLAALTSGNILVGSAGNVATSVNPAGAVEISNTGATSLAYDQGTESGTTVNAAATDSQATCSNPAAGTYLAFAQALVRSSSSGTQTDVNIELRKNTTGFAFMEIQDNPDSGGVDTNVSMHGITTANGTDDFHIFFDNNGAAAVTVYHATLTMLRVA